MCHSCWPKSSIPEPCSAPDLAQTPGSSPSSLAFVPFSRPGHAAFWGHTEEMLGCWLWGRTPAVMHTRAEPIFLLPDLSGPGCLNSQCPSCPTVREHPPQLPSSAVSSLCASRDPSQRAPEPRRALHTILEKAKRRCPVGTLLRAGCLPPRGLSSLLPAAGRPPAVSR